MSNGSFALGLLFGAIASPLLLFLVGYQYVRGRQRKSAYEPPWIPGVDKVPLDWEAQTLDGETILLHEHLAGRVVFLNFWATWCPPCVGEAASIDKLYHRFKGRVSFACLSQEHPGRIRRFQTRNGYQFPMFHLRTQPPLTFQTPGIPATFILSKSQRVVCRHVGAADWAHESVVQLLETLLVKVSRNQDLTWDDRVNNTAR